MGRGFEIEIEIEVEKMMMNENGKQVRLVFLWKLI